eukprot:SAG11_NODE_24636_length_370_cov_1.077491_2_plen_29_part_01
MALATHRMTNDSPVQTLRWERTPMILPLV